MSTNLCIYFFLNYLKWKAITAKLKVKLTIWQPPMLFCLFYFKQYLVRGAYSSARLVWMGPDEKEKTTHNTNREYFMESAGVRYLRTSCWRIRNRTSERSERVRFLIQKQRVCKYRTKHFPCCIVFIIYILRHSSFWRPFYFKPFTNAKICHYTLTAKWQRKRRISFSVETFF